MKGVDIGTFVCKYAWVRLWSACYVRKTMTGKEFEMVRHLNVSAVPNLTGFPGARALML